MKRVEGMLSETPKQQSDFAPSILSRWTFALLFRFPSSALNILPTSSHHHRTYNGQNFKYFNCISYPFEKPRLSPINVYFICTICCIDTLGGSLGEISPSSTTLARFVSPYLEKKTTDKKFKKRHALICHLAGIKWKREPNFRLSESNTFIRAKSKCSRQGAAIWTVSSWRNSTSPVCETKVNTARDKFAFPEW